MPKQRPLKRGLPAMHPGELLREVSLPHLKSKGLGKTKIAAAMGISRQALEDIVKAKAAITPEMALRLSRYFRTSAELWLNLQRSWDLEKAEARIGDQLARIKPLSRKMISG